MSCWMRLLSGQPQVIERDGVQFVVQVHRQETGTLVKHLLAGGPLESLDDLAVEPQQVVSVKTE